MMKKILTLLLCILSAVSFAGCSHAGNADNTSGTANASSDTQLPNPFTDCSTLDDAAAVSGFTMTVPDAIDGYPERMIQAMQDDMIQVLYSSDSGEICVRKASRTGDISGDYNDYAETGTVSVGSISVTRKGSNGKIHVAIWENNGYSYSIGISGDGLAEDTVSALVSAVS